MEVALRISARRVEMVVSSANVRTCVPAGERILRRMAN